MCVFYVQWLFEVRGSRGLRSSVLGWFLPLNAPPFVPFPLVGLSATSCPSSMPQFTWDIAAGMLYVADKPAEIRPRRGRRHRNW